MMMSIPLPPLVDDYDDGLYGGDVCNCRLPFDARDPTSLRVEFNCAVSETLAGDLGLVSSPDVINESSPDLCWSGKLL